MNRISRLAAPLGWSRRIATLLVVGGSAALLSGCFATTKHVQLVETDLTRQGAWTDERFQAMRDELGAVRSENETLRLRLDDLTDQISSLGGEVSARLSELSASDEQTIAEVRRTAQRATADAQALETTREADRADLLGRMNVILEEVVAENARLQERIGKLEEGAFTFGRMHTVRGGESVASIATQYGVTPEEIVSANDLPNANLIQVGQKLLVPGVTP